MPVVAFRSGKGSPRDLAAVRDGLERAAAVATRLRTTDQLPQGLSSAARELAAAGEGACAAVAGSLRRALAIELPATIKELGFVADGYATRLDDARRAAARAKQAIEELQGAYMAQTGVKSLRIRVNTLVGYHIEVPAAQAKALREEFTLRQGLASSTRFSTTKLDALAIQLEEASSQIASAEQAVFTELSYAVLGIRETLSRVAHASAALDLVAGLAQAAAEGLWVEPELVEGPVLDIEGGRHPAAERLLEEQGRSFVPNDCRMG